MSLVAQPSVRFTGTVWWLTGLLFGVATQLLFLWTVVALFLFLRYGAPEGRTGSLWTDVALATLFAVPHSLLLFPAVQRRMRLWMPSAWLGCVHCIVTCFSLLVLFRCWIPSPIAVWQMSGWSEAWVLSCFYGSWIALLYSLYLTGLGYQTGLTPWWYWLRGVPPPRRAMVTRGVYRWLRHPVYLSFLGLVWFTPQMTLDHVILTSIWTFYIFVGSVFKDLRLKKFIGQPYIDYARQVPGYPFVGWGILGRWKSDGPE